jgi:predicted Zn-dependent protease with MMP-like domain
VARWKELVELAQGEVQRTLDQLPDELRVPARELPVTCEPYPSEELEADGIEADTLGLFVGEALAETGGTAAPLPAQIILFLENLWDYAEEDTDIFLEEVHITYVHELGHYLGLDEDELIDRGLE